jgi:predicted RNase H-like HicB family nuclease
MSDFAAVAYDNETRADNASVVYDVVIHPCEDVPGYWAECVSLPGCFTDGDTIRETERNMYESVGLFLRDGSLAISDFSLKFEVSNA